MTTKTRERDEFIVNDYTAGRDVSELAREHGVSPRRVQQILSSHSVPLRQRRASRDKSPISRKHELIGQRLTNHMYDADLQPNDVANDLGWSFQKVWMIQQGIAEIELLDLLDLCAYVGDDLKKAVLNG